MTDGWHGPRPQVGVGGQGHGLGSCRGLWSPEYTAASRVQEGPSRDSGPAPLMPSPGHPFLVRTAQPGDRALPSPSEPHLVWGSCR